MTELKKAESLLSTGDDVAALKVLLDHWRSEPAPETGDAIVMLGRRIHRNQESLSELRTEPAIQSIVERRAPEDLNRVCQYILAHGIREARDRIDMIADWPDDPRLDRWLMMNLIEIPFQSTYSQPFFRRLFRRIMKRSRDFTLVERFVAASEGYPDMMGQSMARFLTEYVPKVQEAAQAHFAIARQFATLSQSDQDVLAKITAKLDEPKGGPPTNETILLHQIYQSPDDDDARQVYADALQDRGDPHGEFIMLQYDMQHGEPTKQMVQRERQLIREHGMEFVGALSEVVQKTTMRFERGFLSRCTVKSGAKLKRTLGAPEWSTVRELSANYEVYAQKQMRSLRTVQLDSDEFEQFCQHPTPWPVTEIHTRLTPNLIEQMQSCDVLPSLDTLWVQFTWNGYPRSAIQRLLPSEFGQQIQHLGVYWHFGNYQLGIFKPWRKWLAEHGHNTNLQSFGIRKGNWTAPIATFSPNANGDWTCGRLDLKASQIDGVVTELDRLPGNTFSELEYTFQGRAPAQLPNHWVRALRRFKRAAIRGPKWPESE